MNVCFVCEFDCDGEGCPCSCHQVERSGAAVAYSEHRPRFTALLEQEPEFFRDEYEEYRHRMAA